MIRRLEGIMMSTHGCAITLQDGVRSVRWLLAVALVVLSMLQHPQIAQAQEACGDVVDLAGRLDPEDRDRLQADVDALSAAGIQAHVILLNATSSGIDDWFATTLADCGDWRSGSRREPRLLVLAVAIQERRTGTWFGEGLRPDLDPVHLDVHEEMAPLLRDSAFGAALHRGLQRYGDHLGVDLGAPPSGDAARTAAVGATAAATLLGVVGLRRRSRRVAAGRLLDSTIASAVLLQRDLDRRWLQVTGAGAAVGPGAAQAMAVAGDAYLRAAAMPAPGTPVDVEQTADQTAAWEAVVAAQRQAATLLPPADPAVLVDLAGWDGTDADQRRLAATSVHIARRDVEVMSRRLAGLSASVHAATGADTTVGRAEAGLAAAWATADPRAAAADALAISDMLSGLDAGIDVHLAAIRASSSSQSSDDSSSSWSDSSSSDSGGDSGGGSDGGGGSSDW